jgi:hypothetical protein
VDIGYAEAVSFCLLLSYLLLNVDKAEESCNSFIKQFGVIMQFSFGLIPLSLEINEGVGLQG